MSAAEDWAIQQSQAKGYYVSPSAAPVDLPRQTINAAPTIIGGPDPAAPPPADAAAAAYWGSAAAAQEAATPPNAAPPPGPASTTGMSANDMASRSVAAMNAPPPTDLPPLTGQGAGAPTSIAALRDGSSQMNAEAQGAPHLTPTTTKEQTAAAKALAYYGVARHGGPAAAGGGAGAPRGPSAHDNLLGQKLGTYDAEGAAMQAGADAEKGKAAVMAEGGRDIARQHQEDAAIQQMEAANAAKTFSDYQAETQRQIDDVRAKKIDPNRAYSDTGSAIASVIGGLMGGIYQGINKLQSNPFIDQMNKTMDRDIAAQETDLRTAKEAIGERKNMLAEMRATYKDDALAKAQAKNLYIEGAKEELLARAGDYDSPAIQSRVDQGLTALSRMQVDLKLSDLQQKAAAAQAAGAAAEHRRQLDFQNAILLDKQRIEHQKADTEEATAGGKAGHDDTARFVGTGKDAQGNPTGYVARTTEDAKEREGARIAAKKLIDQIDQVLTIRADQGGAGRAVEQTVHGIYDTKAANDLAVLESDMTTTAAQAAHLGALSDSDRQLMNSKFHNLNSVGSGAEERLLRIKAIAERQLRIEEEEASGARATKTVGANGRERVDLSGASNAPNNQRTVPRERVGP
jgi:hypothetical protein